MGLTIIEKIVQKHLLSGEMKAGNEIQVSVDQTLTQDVLGTMAYLQFQALGADKVKTRSVSYVDHNTLQSGFENADDHIYLQTVADKYGITFSKPGNGICHQLHLERFSKPGDFLIGGDSHTPTGGGAGQLSIGVGGLEIAGAMASGKFYFTMPKIIRVNLEGRLQPWCSAKDIILEVLKHFTTKGNVGMAIEYGGSGLPYLTVPERATITNMGAEMGITTSIFPSDEVTQTFLKAQKRLEDWSPLAADEDAVYADEITIDVSAIVPNIACPHSPDQVVTVESIEGLPVDQVLLGSCTNSSYKDLLIAAYMMKGHKAYDRVSFGIAPGSRQVQEMAMQNGLMTTFMDGGARLFESACGFCCGAGQSPKSRGVSLRTNNRNYKGRSGTQDADVYLVSPETAIASAITGVITDPRKFAAKHNLAYPSIELPAEYVINDTLFIKPTCNPATEVVIGPNIGAPPKNQPYPDTLEAKVGIKLGDKITTDDITPAGSLLKYRSNVPKYSEYVFSFIKPDFAKTCMANRDAGIASVIVAGESYGQGSSREHAALCPMFLGVKVVLAKSVERIHSSNLVNFGILQLAFVDSQDYDSIEDGDTLILDNLHQGIKSGKVTIFNKTKNRYINAVSTLTERQKEILLAGGFLNFLLEA